MADTDPSEKPLPLPRRPGTAGTELMLRSNLQISYSAYKKAHQAETAYRARKQAQLAKANHTEAKVELKQATVHFKKGITLTIGGLKALPAIVRAKMEEAKENRLRREREQAYKKKELWEKKARDAEENTPAVPAKDGEEAVATGAVAE